MQIHLIFGLLPSQNDHGQILQNLFAIHGIAFGLETENLEACTVDNIGFS